LILLAPIRKKERNKYSLPPSTKKTSSKIWDRLIGYAPSSSSHSLDFGGNDDVDDDDDFIIYDRMTS
jgi:hypothetical protein